MGCGCGKGREATSAAKDRIRSGGGQVGTLNQYMSGSSPSPSNVGYTRRVNEYNQTLRNFIRGR